MTSNNFQQKLGFGFNTSLNDDMFVKRKYENYTKEVMNKTKMVVIHRKFPLKNGYQTWVK